MGAWGCLCYLYSGMFEVFGFVARLVYRLAFPAYDDDGFTSSRGGHGTVSDWVVYGALRMVLLWNLSWMGMSKHDILPVYRGRNWGFVGELECRYSYPATLPPIVISVSSAGYLQVVFFCKIL